jgi:hypothetical protein
MTTHVPNCKKSLIEGYPKSLIYSTFAFSAQGREAMPMNIPIWMFL